MTRSFGRWLKKGGREREVMKKRKIVREREREQMNGKKHRWIEKQIDKRKYSQLYRQREKKVNGKKHRWIEKQIDKKKVQSALQIEREKSDGLTQKYL